MAAITFTEPVARFGDNLIIEERESENPAGFVVGLVILVALLGLFFYYLLPYVQSAFTATDAVVSQQGLDN